VEKGNGGGEMRGEKNKLDEVKRVNRHARTHTHTCALAHTQNSVRVMVIAAFQRIRGLIGYRFGDVMRLIIEPAAGAREGRLAGWLAGPIGRRARGPRTANALYIRARTVVFLYDGGATPQRYSVRPFPRWRSARDIYGRRSVPAAVVVRSERTWYFFTLHSRVVGSPKNVLVRFLIITISFLILHNIII